MKARIRFEKGGVLRFVGHLDMMRYFQKAIRRSDIPIAYSQGYHPHQQMSFAMPLGVGVTSEAEYMDIDLESEVGPEDTIKALNETMAEGVRVLDMRYLSENDGNAMASVAASTYFLYVKDGEKYSYDLISDMKSRRFDGVSSMLIEKKTKKSVREVDLKPFIYDFRLEKMSADTAAKMQRFVPDFEANGFLLKEGDPAIILKVSAGSEENIKPELFMRYLLDEKEEWDYFPFGIHRLELLKHDGEGGFCPL